jgi:site-specific DNA-methyltransferase (adenine-specific)
MKMSTQVDLFTDVQPTSVSPAIAKPFVSRSTFYQGDCLVEMNKIEDKSVDLILCDLPYAVTAFKWDSFINLKLLWNCYDRILKDNATAIFTATQPFSSILVTGNIEMFKYGLVWDKLKGTSFAIAKKKPMASHEDILVFGRGKMTYNPQMELAEKKNKRPRKNEYKTGGAVPISSGISKVSENHNEDLRYPKSVIRISKDMGECNHIHRIHPTQKPVELMEYLIKTYTNEGETVLDNCMGSGTTGVACKKTGRHFIGIEKDEKYFEIAVSRVSAYCG